MSSYAYYASNANATAQLAETGNTQLATFEVENINTDTVVYLQLFDAAATGDVTVGTTTPIQSYQVHIGTGDGNAGGGLESGVREKYFRDPLRFSLGLVWAVTKDREGNTAPTSNCIVNFTLI